jgi:hypothetical protein
MPNRGFLIFPYSGIEKMGSELPVGTEKINSSGYVMVKISMRNKKGLQFGRYSGAWENKHHLIWEKHNGRVPKGYRVIFLDGCKYNYKLDNLAIATTNEVMLLNHYGLQFNDSELTRTGLAIARQRAQIGRLMKQTHNTYNMPKAFRGGKT